MTSKAPSVAMDAPVRLMDVNGNQVGEARFIDD
jgi:hypothetical protein